MRYKIYIANTDQTLSRLSRYVFHKKGDTFISTHGEREAKNLKPMKEGVYYRPGFRFYCIPETHPYFNFDLAENIMTSVPLTLRKVTLYKLFKQIGNIFYKYIYALTPGVNTKYK